MIYPSGAASRARQVNNLNAYFSLVRFPKAKTLLKKLSINSLEMLIPKILELFEVEF